MLDISEAGCNVVVTYNNAADVEEIRAGKLSWALSATGVISSRRVAASSRFSTNGGVSYSAATPLIDDAGFPVNATGPYFGSNVATAGILSILIPVGISAANFRIQIDITETSFSGPGTFNFSFFEFYIDGGAAQGRIITMFLPSPGGG